MKLAPLPGGAKISTGSYVLDQSVKCTGVRIAGVCINLTIQRGVSRKKLEVGACCAAWIPFWHTETARNPVFRAGLRLRRRKRGAFCGFYRL